MIEWGCAIRLCRFGSNPKMWSSVIDCNKIRVASWLTCESLMNQRIIHRITLSPENFYRRYRSTFSKTPQTPRRRLLEKIAPPVMSLLHYFELFALLAYLYGVSVVIVYGRTLNLEG
jgi:hypothetical protein